MTPEMHDRFATLYDELVKADGNAAQVFVPVGPDEIGPLRLLFIGQATRGWSEEALEDYETAWRRAVDIVAAPLPGSKYWQVVRRIVAAVGRSVGLSDISDRLPEFIGWSNLVKVGHPDRNPYEASWKAQADLCLEQLRHEVELMRPDAIVVMTRDFASKEILLPMFGETGWEQDVPEKDRVAWKLAPMPVVWMNHPRRMGPSGYLEASIQTAVNVIGGYLSSSDSRTVLR